MKKFNEFIVSTKINVVPEPIHFKRRGLIGKPYEDAAVVPGAIHFKYVLPNTKISEDTDPVQFAAKHKDVDKAMGHEDTWFGKPGHAKNIAKHINLSKQLHGLQKKAGIKLTKEHKKHIGFYTEGEDYGPSLQINHRRIDNYKKKKPPQHGIPEYYAKVDSTIHSLAKNPIGKAHSVYSGVGFNPQTLVNKSKTGTMHSPAHISTTHDPGTAKSFAETNAGGNTLHIMHVKLKPEDKAFHIGDHSAQEHEHETVIPGGTTFRHLGTTSHKDKYGSKYKIHHFEIAHQED